MLIFCCHKCHTKEKFWWKNRPFWEGRKRNKNDFWLAFSMCFLPLSPLFIKIHQKYTVETWFIAHCIYPCDTCDSKKTKTPVMCVRAYARERENIDIFTTQIWGCWSPLHCSIYFHFWMLIENNTLFCEKWAVVLWKTTRRFMKNNTSFCRKQAVVLWKYYALSNRQNRLFSGFALRTIEFLMIPPWPLARKRPIHPRLRGKNSFNLWLSTLSTRWFVPMFQHEQKSG